MKEKEIIYKELSYKVIGAAIETHKRLGHGFLESVYDEALGIEFKAIELNYEYQKELKILYREKYLEKTFRVDYVVENKILVDDKATKGITEIDEAQMLNYLKASGFKLGIVINFGQPSLEYKRIAN